MTITKSSNLNSLIVAPRIADSLIQAKDSMGTYPGVWEMGYSSTAYCGNIIRSGNRTTVLNPHGYTTIDTNKTTGEQTTTRYYYLKDHLGSNRVVFRDNGLVVQENHYYAYGNLTADCYGTDAQQYKYNGKELDRKLGIDLYDYGARWYDATGRLGFTTMDPLCEEDYGVSPYVYCRDNPVNAIDPDGRKVVIHYRSNSGKDLTYSFQGFRGAKTIKFPNVPFIRDFITAYLYNAKNGGGKNIIKAATNDKYNIHLYDGANSPEFGNPNTHSFSWNGQNIVRWQSRMGLKFDEGYQSPATSLEHEFDHAVDKRNNPSAHRDRVSDRGEQYSNYDNAEEMRVIEGAEKETAKANGENIRHHHHGTFFKTSSPTSIKWR